MDGPDLRESVNLARLPGHPYHDVVERLSNALMKWHATLPPGKYDRTTPCDAISWAGMPAVSEGSGSVGLSARAKVYEDSDPEPWFGS